MLTPDLQQVIKAWPQMSELIFVPHSEAEYQKSVVLLNHLIDEVGEDETHPLASLMETVGALIENYESQHFPEPSSDPIGMITFLMEQHRLQLGDLLELGNEKSAKEILAGKQDLTLRQIYALSDRFHVSPAVFV